MTTKLVTTDVLVIGGDSYLGSKFIRDYSDNFIIKAISRKETDYENGLTACIHQSNIA